MASYGRPYLPRMRQTVAAESGTSMRAMPSRRRAGEALVRDDALAGSSAGVSLNHGSIKPMPCILSVSLIYCPREGVHRDADSGSNRRAAFCADLSE